MPTSSTLENIIDAVKSARQITRTDLQNLAGLQLYKNLRQIFSQGFSTKAMFGQSEPTLQAISSKHLAFALHLVHLGVLAGFVGGGLLGMILFISAPNSLALLTPWLIAQAGSTAAPFLGLAGLGVTMTAGPLLGAALATILAPIASIALDTLKYTTASLVLLPSLHLVKAARDLAKSAAAYKFKFKLLVDKFKSCYANTTRTSSYDSLYFPRAIEQPDEHESSADPNEKISSDEQLVKANLACVGFQEAVSNGDIPPECYQPLRFSQSGGAESTWASKSFADNESDEESSQISAVLAAYPGLTRRQ